MVTYHNERPRLPRCPGAFQFQLLLIERIILLVDTNTLLSPPPFSLTDSASTLLMADLGFRPCSMELAFLIGT